MVVGILDLICCNKCFFMLDGVIQCISSSNCFMSRGLILKYCFR